MMLRMNCSSWGAETTAIAGTRESTDIHIGRSVPDTAIVTVVTEGFDLRISLADLRAYLNQRLNAEIDLRHRPWRPVSR